MSGVVRRDLPSGPSSNGGSIYEGGPGNYAANAGGRAANFDELYKQIRDKNEQASQEAEKKERRELQGADALMASLSNMGDAIQNFGGFNERFSEKVEQGGLGTDPAGTLLNFVPTLPLGIVGGYPRGIASGYEAVTGHAVRDADMDTMTMSNQDLDPMQRAGSAVNAGIELAGPLMGGSGRLLGGVGNVARKASEKADDVLGKVMPAEGRGLLHRIGKESGLGEVASTAGQLAFDVGEEAGEEFVQSYADDFRFQSLDDSSFSRALEGAGWGALGGGIMSGAGLALSKASGAGRTAQDAPADTGTGMTGESNKIDRSAIDFQERLVPSAKAYVDEHHFDRSVKEPGSFGAVMVPGEYGQNLNDVRIGVEDFRSAWRAQDDGARQLWAGRLGTTVENLDSMMGRTDLHEALNQLVEAKGEKIRTSLVRNPGTSFSSKFSANLAGFDSGYGMKLNALAYQLSGGDVDGDTRTIRFADDEKTPYPLPSQLMANRLSGDRTSMNLEYMPFLNTDEAHDAVTQILTKKLAPIDVYGKGGYINRIASAARTASADKGNDFGREVTQLRTQLSKIKGIDADEVIADIVTSIQASVTEETVFRSILNDQLEPIDEQVVRELGKIATAKGGERWSSGNIADIQNIAGVAHLLDLVYGSTGAVKSLWFRQTASLKLEHGKRFPMLRDIMSYMGGYGTDAINNRIAMWMRLAAEGEHVEEIISNEFNAYIELRFADILAESGNASSDNRIGEDGRLSVDEFTDAFQRAYNEAVDLYDDAIKKTSYSGAELVVGAIYKNPIDFESDRTGAMSAMLRTIGTANIEEYVHIEPANMLYGMTIDQIASQTGSQGVDAAYFTGLGTETRNFLYGLGRAAGDQNARVNNALLDNLEKIPRINPELALQSDHYNQAMWILESFFNSVAPEVGLYASIGKVSDAIEAGYGDIIFNGTGEQRANLAIALSLQYKYGEAIDEVAKYESTGDRKHLDHAVKIVNAMVDKSALSQAIYSDLTKRDSVHLVKMLGNLDISYSEKVEALHRYYDNASVKNEPLLVSAVRTDSSSMGISAISKRVVTMNVAITSAHRNDTAKNKQVVDRLFKYIEDLDEGTSQISPYLLKDYFSSNMIQSNRKIMAALIGDSRIISLRSGEKGTVIDSACMNYQQVEKRFMGSPVGMIQNMTGWRFGKMSLEEFGSNKVAITDVLFNGGTVTLYDGVTETPNVGAQEFLRMVTGRDEVVENGMLELRQLRLLFDACPQLVNVLSEGVVTPTTSKEEGGGIRQSAADAVVCDLDVGFKRFVNKRGSSIESIVKQREMDKVEWELMARPDYYEMVAYATELEGGAPLQVKIIEAHERLVDFFYNAARNGTFSVDDMKDTLERSMFTRAMRDLKENVDSSGRLAKLIDRADNPSRKFVRDHALSIESLAASVLEEGFYVEKMSMLKEMFDNASNNLEKMKIAQFASEMESAAKDVSGLFFRSINKGHVMGDYTQASIAIVGEDVYVDTILNQMLGMANAVNIDDSVKRMIEPAVQKAKAILKMSLDDVISNSKCLFKSDMTNMSSFNMKLIKILNDPRYATLNEDDRKKTAEKVAAMHKSFKSGDMTEIEYLDAVEPIRVRINNLVMKAALRDLSAESGANINIDMFNDVSRIPMAIDKIVDVLKGDPDIEVTQSRAGDPKPPRMYFGDTMHSFMAANARFYAQTGQIGTNVGVNGSVLNNLMGIAILPHDRSCSGEPSTVTSWEELKMHVPEYEGMYAVIDKGDGRNETIWISPDTFSRDWKNRFPPGARVELYNSSGCNCGWCSKHSHVAFNGDNKRYIDISDIITTLLDFSQEDANLKLKKSLEASERLCGKLSLKPEYTFASEDVQASMSPDDVYARLSDTRRLVVNDVAEAYYQTMNENDIPLDYKDAERLAQFLCSVFRVESADGRSMYIHMEQLAKGEWSKVQTEMGADVKVTPSVLTLDQINKKIMAEVASERRPGGMLEDPSRKNLQDVAWRALTDWSGYGRRKINVKAAMNLIDTLPRAGRSNMLPADAETALMSWKRQQELMGNKRYPESDPLRTLADDNQIDEIRELTEKLMPNSNGFQITSIVTTDKSDIKFSSSAWADDKYSQAKRIIGMYRGKDAVRVPNDLSAVIVADRDMAKKMLDDYDSDAYRHDYAIVPEDTFDNSETPIGARTVSLFGENFLLIDTASTKRIKYEQGQRFRYSASQAAYEQFCICYGDDLGLLQLPDSGSFGHPEFLKNLWRMDTKPVEFSFGDQLDGDMSSVEIVPLNKFSEMKAYLDENPRAMAWPRIEKLDRKKAEEAVSAVLDGSAYLSTGFDEDGIRRSNIAMHSVVGFASQMTVDGEMVYMPLIVSGNHPRMIDSLGSVTKRGDRFIIGAETKVMFGSEDFRKLAFPGEAYKTVTVYPDEEVVESDMMIMAPAMLGRDFHNIINYDGKSQKGRLYGRGDQVLKGNLYGGSKTFPCSARFMLTADGWVRNPRLNAALDDATIDALFDPTTVDPAWRRIANGEITLFDERYREANAAIQKIARGAAIEGNGVVPSTILEPWRFGTSLSEMRAANEEAEAAGKNPPAFTEQPMFRPIVHDQILGILGNLNNSEALAMFNMVSEDLCPPNLFDRNRTTLVRSDGKILGMWKGKAYYLRGRIGQVTTMKVESEVGEGIATAAFGKQHVIKHAIERGVRDQDVDEIVSAIMANQGNVDGFAGMQGRAYRSAADRDNDFADTTTTRFQTPTIDILDGPWVNGYAREVMNRQIDKQARTFTSLGVVVTRGTGDNKEVYRSANELRKFEPFKTAMDELCSALGCNSISVELMMNLVKSYCGWSWSDGEGSNEIKIQQVVNTVRHIASNISSSTSQYIIEGGKLDVQEDRVSIAMLPKGVARDLWSVSPSIRAKFGDDFNMFKKSMETQMENSWDAIKSIQYVAKGIAGKKQETKKTALKLMAMYVEKSWGKPPATSEIFAGVDFEDLRECISTACRAVLPDATRDQLDEIISQIETAKRRAVANAERVNSRHQNRVYSQSAERGYEILVKNSSFGMGTKVMKSLESMVRVMGVANLWLAPANIIESMGHTAILKAGINMKVGPYSQKRSMSAETVSTIATDDRLVRYYKAYKEAVLLGMDNEFIVGYTNAQDKDQFIADLYAGRTPLEKLSDRLFKLTSQENMFLRSQLELTLARFDQLCNADNIVEQIIEDENGVTLMQTKLIDDPVSWLNDVLAANSPSRMEWMRAANWAEGTSMARENAVSLLTRELFERVPLASFASTTMFTPFYRYVTNYTGRVLNWFMPVSAMNYVMNEALMDTELGQRVGIERAQVHTSLGAAVFADAMHMSIPVLVCLLVGMTGCLEPPEDEDKIIDFREWTFFGFRVAPEWWIQDCLGPALPMACWVKSAMNGKPRMDILFQGLGIVLQSNPLMSIADLVNVLVEPDTFVEGWQEESDRYMWAPGGEPTSSEMLIAKASQFGLNCLGKFITPSFLKEWYRDAQKYEKSYKRVYVQGVSDVNSEAGQTADTERVDYREAMIRQCTRRNPVLGFIMDFTTKPTTSYMALGNPILDIQGMPNVEYQDPIQRGIMDRYSINEKNEKGEYVRKSDAEMQQVALDVIATLEAYDDMEELRSTGFMIDYDTRAYVSEQIWGIIKNANTSFYSWYNSPESDPNVLSPGDYWAGREMRNQAYQENQALVEYWKSLYYDKLWSTPMKLGVQKYFRENTDYRQDANGEWYASGFPMATSPLGVKIASGTTTDPQGTMGREGDWATPSAVVEGENTWERALVPFSEDLADTPDIESWDKDDDSNGNGKGNQTSSGYNPYRYGRRGGGGGGGGGYRTSIYSHPGSVSMSSPRVSSSGIPQDTRFDYLRPGFETKGSREANRRSDF